MAHEHHARDHAHGHGHAHDHHDAAALIDERGLHLTLDEHDGSLVAAYRLVLPAGLDAAQQALCAFASSLARDVADTGGIVGHVKAVAREQGAGFRLSVTFDEPDVAPLDEPCVRIEGVAIVLACDRAWYEQRLIAGLHALVP